MPDWLFPNALDDEAAYRRAQEYWRQKVWKLIFRAGREAAWTTPWKAEDLPGGNPIWIAESKATGRSFRVIFLEPGKPDEYDLIAWTEDVTSPIAGTKLTELVIACSPSQENEELVDHLLFDWIRDGRFDWPPEEEDPRDRFDLAFRFATRGTPSPRAGLAVAG